jgi:very-short-patch-repair endonuclease
MAAGRTSGARSERPARIWNKLVVEGVGDPGLALVAGAQRGIVHQFQLAALQLGRSAVRHRIAKGSLHPVLPLVFAVGSAVLQPLAAETAALLYAGDDCGLSHRTAAALWGMVDGEGIQPVQLTAVSRKVRHRPGLHAYQTMTFDLRDLRLHHGLPVTSPARTVIDYAAVATSVELERALAEARVLKLITDRDLEAAIHRAPLRAGVAAIKELLKDEAAQAFTRSEAERVLRRLVADAGLPAPQTNVKLLGFEVDMLWPEQRVVVEADGYDTHRHPAAFERDRRRDQVLQAAGYHVIRVTWRQLKREPVGVAVRIAQTLALAATRG